MNGLLGPGALYLFAIRALVTLIVIPFHESAHALVSWLLGDPTAKNAGRLSLNPLRHFDPVGTVCMLLGGVGWARPVGVQPYRFRNPKVGMAVSAAAGPMSNLLLAYICMILYKAAVYATNGELGRGEVRALYVAMGVYQSWYEVASRGIMLRLSLPLSAEANDHPVLDEDIAPE